MEVKDYMAQPYTTLIKKITDESGTYWYATVLELDGCQSTGDTEEEAVESIKEAMEGWIETKLAHGFSIPLPHESEYSGKLNIRIPRELHQKLAVSAKMQNVSLNQYILCKLAQ